MESFARTKKVVEEGILALGLDPNAVRSKDAPEFTSWVVARGSAQVLVSVTLRDEAVFLRVASAVVVLPPAQPQALRERLFTKCLELNANGLGNCAFGLIGDRIVVVSERPATGLDAGEVEQTVRLVAVVADKYDDLLVKEFGGKRASDP